MEESKALNHIPAELLDHIASHLDRRSLKSLSLVNHTLCGATQRELFKEIHICYTFGITYGLMECDQNHTPTGEGFLELLTSSPHLAPYIQDLQVNFERCKAKVHHPQVSFMFILPLLTRLQRLLIPFPALAESPSPLNQPSWRGLKPAMRAAIQRSLQSPLLLEADLRGFRDIPPDVFENCQALQYLSIDALAISQMGNENDNNSEPPLAPSLTNNIKFLELGLCQVTSSPSLDDTASYLFSPRCTIPIQWLCYLVVSFPLQLHILSGILAQCSEYLEYLSFVSLPETRSCYITTGTNKGVRKHALPPLDLSIVPNLRILTIHTRIDASSSSSYLSALPWIRATIDTLSPTCLEKITLEVNMKGFPRYPSGHSMTILTIDWSDIPHALLRRHDELKFNNLLTVRLKLKKLSASWDGVDQGVLELRRKFPFSSRLLGQLRVHKDFVRLHSEHLQILHGQILSIS